MRPNHYLRCLKARAVGIAVLSVAALGVGAALATPLPGEPGFEAVGALRILQLDVGQGDAALITTPDGRRILIDAGPNADVVADILRAEGVDSIDLVVASHNHADHIGGMPQVLAAFAVRAYIENGIPQPTAIYQRTIAALEREAGLLFLEATDRTITIGTVTVRILSSPGVNNLQNDNSVGVVIEHGTFTALYTGDSELRQLAGWLKQGRTFRATMVKVAHHGSRNGTAPEWVRATAPAMAIISVGARNAYGHPSVLTESLWTAVGARVLRTDELGTIEISATPDGRFSIRAVTPPGAHTP